MKIEKGDVPNLRKAAHELRRMGEKRAELTHEHWPLYDSDISSFAYEFKSLIPGGLNARNEKECSELFIEYIKTILRPDRNRHLKAVELGGPGIRLFEGFPKGFF